MALSFLTTQKATPKRSGWLRYFFVALALYPPVYVHAAESNNWTGEASTTWTTEGSAGAWADGAVYADGNTVTFGTDVSSTEARKVTIDGIVAPGGVIKVDTGSIGFTDVQRYSRRWVSGIFNPVYEWYADGFVTVLGTGGESGGTMDAQNSIWGSETTSPDAEPVHAYMTYGYAFEGGTIADYRDANGNLPVDEDENPNPYQYHQDR